jgi:hypothetical protein
MATNRKSRTVRWTRKGEIERLVWQFSDIMEPQGKPMSIADWEWLEKALDRFARKVLKEHYAKEIAASTEVLALRERVRTLEGRIGVMAEVAGPPDCPPETKCHPSGLCSPCWREWGLG